MTVEADAIIKFGQACLYDDQEKIEILYVFAEDKTVKSESLFADVAKLKEDSVVG